MYWWCLDEELRVQSAEGMTVGGENKLVGRGCVESMGKVFHFIFT